MARVISIRVDNINGSSYTLKCNVFKESGIEGDRNRDLERAIAIVDDQFIVNKTTITDGFCSLRFKENIIIEGLDVSNLDANVTLTIGTSRLQISDIGKKCHKNCPAYKLDGSCLMYKHVAFARILEDGVICIDDVVEVV